MTITQIQYFIALLYIYYILCIIYYNINTEVGVFFWWSESDPHFILSCVMNYELVKKKSHAKWNTVKTRVEKENIFHVWYRMTKRHSKHIFFHVWNQEFYLFPRNVFLLMWETSFGTRFKKNIFPTWTFLFPPEFFFFHLASHIKKINKYINLGFSQMENR